MDPLTDDGPFHIASEAIARGSNFSQHSLFQTYKVLKSQFGSALIYGLLNHRNLRGRTFLHCLIEVRVLHEHFGELKLRDFLPKDALEHLDLSLRDNNCQTALQLAMEMNDLKLAEEIRGFACHEKKVT